MKTFALVVAAAVLVTSGLAQAQPSVKSNVQTIDGDQARNVMLAMIGDKNTQWIENSVCMTVVRNESKAGATECTLIGSHGSCPTGQHPIYSCQIESAN